MAMRYAQAAQTKRLAVVRDLVDGGGGPGCIELIGEPPELTLTVPLERPCATVKDHLLGFNGLPLFSDSAPVDGELKYGRAFDGDGNEIISCLPIGTEAEPSILVLDSLTLRRGERARISAAYLRHPNG